jgi:hypothetical protein
MRNRDATILRLNASKLLNVTFSRSNIHQKNLKLPFRASDYLGIPAHRQRLTKRNPECLEHCLALVVIVLPGKYDMRRDAGTGAQAVEEMLKDIDWDGPDRLVAKGAIIDKVSPSPAIEHDRCN